MQSAVSDKVVSKEAPNIRVTFSEVPATARPRRVRSVMPRAFRSEPETESELSDRPEWCQADRSQTDANRQQRVATTFTSMTSAALVAGTASHSLGSFPALCQTPAHEPPIDVQQPPQSATNATNDEAGSRITASACAVLKY